MKRILLAVAVAALLARTSSAKGFEATVRPLYACSGVNFQGHAYDMTLETKHQGNLVAMHWYHDGDEMVAYGWQDADKVYVSLLTPSGTSGIAVYSVKGDTLKGSWLFYGAPSVQPETCKAIDKAPDEVPVVKPHAPKEHSYSA